MLPCSFLACTQIAYYQVVKEKTLYHVKQYTVIARIELVRQHILTKP